MSYEETIAWLFEQLPMYSRIGAAAYKKDLDNITALCNAIGNPEKKLKCIHVAGTNGKGSTSHMLAAVLQEAGYKTGLYTSPHIKDFRERIRINGTMISKEFVVNFTDKTRALTQEIQPSFFELTAAMAFAYFQEEGTDIAVIETGLGGRLDSTNIIQPFLSVITSIGFDHTDILGDTLEKIATEKAGIIKKAPAVIGETLPETKDVFIKKANEQNTTVTFADEKYITEYIALEGPLLLCNLKNIDTGIVEKLRLDLSGLYQVKNAKTAVCAVDELRKLGLTIPEQALHYGLANVRTITGLYGRWEILQRKPLVIMDCAHNIDGIAQVLSQLQNDHPDLTHHFVLGFVKDKDISGLLTLFPDNSRFYFTNAHIPRALPHDELKKLASSFKLNGDSYDVPDDAVRAAINDAGEKGMVMICGSFFLLAEITLFNQQPSGQGN